MARTARFACAIVLGACAAMSAGLRAPAGTPDAIVKKLNDAARNSLAKAETVERLKALGAVVVGDTPQEFRTYLEKNVERWERVIAASGLKVE